MKGRVNSDHHVKGGQLTMVEHVVDDMAMTRAKYGVLAASKDDI